MRITAISLLILTVVHFIQPRSVIAAEAIYLANQAVLVTSGDTKVLFDPLYDNGYDRYQMVPAEVQQKLMAGETPFDDVDAVFISHSHGDHFTPELMRQYLLNQPDVRVYAPMQAVTALRAASRNAGADDEALFRRVTGIALENGDDALQIELQNISIGAISIPHSGWPERMTDIENLSFRISLDNETTVAHFGDADANAQHFEPYGSYWAAQTTHFAMPPYWFFQSAEGRAILDEVIKPEQAVGTHVLVELPEDEAESLDGYDLFTKPGERRSIH